MSDTRKKNVWRCRSKSVAGDFEWGGPVNQTHFPGSRYSNYHKRIVVGFECPGMTQRISDDWNLTERNWPDSLFIGTSTDACTVGMAQTLMPARNRRCQGPRQSSWMTRNVPLTFSSLAGAGAANSKEKKAISSWLPFVTQSIRRDKTWGSHLLAALDRSLPDNGKYGGVWIATTMEGGAGEYIHDGKHAMGSCKEMKCSVSRWPNSMGTANARWDWWCIYLSRTAKSVGWLTRVESVITVMYLRLQQARKRRVGVGRRSCQRPLLDSSRVYCWMYSWAKFRFPILIKVLIYPPRVL